MKLKYQVKNNIAYYDNFDDVDNVNKNHLEQPLSSTFIIFKYIFFYKYISIILATNSSLEYIF